MKFKSKRSLDRAFMLHPVCIMIMGEMAWWALQRGLPFIVTETGTTKEEDDAVNRKHSVHRQFRGFDVRIHGWSERNLVDFEKYFEKKYKEYAAMSSSRGIENLIEIHTGTARHIHVQISATYAVVGVNIEGKLYEEE